MMIRATPGKMVIHHSPLNRKSLPMRMRVPSEGWVGGTPTPRKESVASARMASARFSVPMTSTGPSTLGSTCCSMILKRPRPMTRAARTYSLLRSTRVEPRTVRANLGHSETPMARMTTKRAIWSCTSRGTAARTMPSISRATRMEGKVSWISAMRMSSASTVPPR